MDHQKRPSIRANAVQFNQRTGVGKIVLQGKFESIPEVDDPVIEIWNALQRSTREQSTGEAINFTILFPTYDEEKDITVYELLPTNRCSNVETKAFLAEAKLEIEILYKKNFYEKFRQFLDEKNSVCNRNLYSLYKSCLEQIENEADEKKKESDISTCRLLIEDFIKFLKLPLPQSKEAYGREAIAATLQKLKEDSLEAGKLHKAPQNIIKLLSEAW